MNILNQISEYASICPERTAICCDGLSVTYGELELYSSRLACHLEQLCGQNRSPIAVYGHKHPLMLVSFLACVKSGRAYCPIDTSVPDSRAEMILDALDSPVFYPSLLCGLNAGTNVHYPWRILILSCIRIYPV
ncbi:MAG: AMP-binding protein [Blautia marasmi]